jgi:two-component sensor histidine kinase
MREAAMNALSHEAERGNVVNEFAAVRPPIHEEKLLLREMAHRVHNEFASAMAIVSLTAARSANDDVKAVLAAVRDRLYRYAQVHRALEVPADDGVVEASGHLHQLCEAIRCSKLDHQGIELVFAGSPVFLPAQQCWRLSMIVSELITNAARHAFRGGPGTIRVELRPSARVVECRVTDSGSGSSNVRPGQGLGIIAALTEGLGGSIAQSFGANGSRSVLTFPASPGVNDGAPRIAVAVREMSERAADARHISASATLR